MSRSLPPLTHKLELGGWPVSFPLTMHAASRASLLFSAPRRAVADVPGGHPFHVVPVGPRMAAMHVAHTSWTDTPVGPFEEISIQLPVYLGTGSPVPGLAPVLHGLLDRTDLVGEYGFLPILSLVDLPDAAAFRRDLWAIEAEVAEVRGRRDGSTSVAQAELRGEPVLRLSVDAGGHAPAPRRRAGMATFGRRGGVPWQDFGRVNAESTVRRYRFGSGRIVFYPNPALRELTGRLGVAGSDVFSRRALMVDLSVGASIRWAGPREVEDREALAATAYTGG